MQRDPTTIQLEKLLIASDRNVYSPEDFQAIGDTEQVTRALDQLITREILAPIGEGLYAKTRRNRINGRQMLAAEGGFDQVAKEALNRLGVEWKIGRAEEAYQNGGTQVPVNTYVRVKGDPALKIGFGDFWLDLEPY